MKAQNNLDTTVFSAQGDTVRRDAIERDRHRRALSFLTGVIVGFSAFVEKTSAAVQWHRDEHSGAIECIQTDEQTGKRVTLRFDSKDELGRYPSLSRIDSPLVSALKKVDIKMPYVNERIQDPGAWKKYVWDEAEKLGVSYEKRSLLTAQDAIGLAIKIVKKNLRYEQELLNENSPLTKRIDATPIDKVLMVEGIGACRHFSVLEDKVYEIFSEDPECRILSNTFMRRLITNDGYHAKNLIGDVREEGNNATTVTLSSIDTSVGKKIVNVGSLYLDDFDVETYELASQKKDTLYQFYTQYLEPLFGNKERLDSKKFFYEKTNLAGGDGLPHIIELTFLYLGAIEDMYAGGKGNDARDIFQDFQGFLKNHTADMNTAVLQDEYDLLHSVFLNIYKAHANAQNNSADREKILREGEEMRLGSFVKRHEALLNAGEVKKALKVGEDYADFLAQTGDTNGAEKFYSELLEVYQKHAAQIGVYERSMPRDNSEYALFIKIEPFKDEGSLQKYLQYKKERIWTQK